LVSFGVEQPHRQPQGFLDMHPRRPSIVNSSSVNGSFAEPRCTLTETKVRGSGEIISAGNPSQPVTGEKFRVNRMGLDFFRCRDMAIGDSAWIEIKLLGERCAGYPCPTSSFGIR